MTKATVCVRMRRNVPQTCVACVAGWGELAVVEREGARHALWGMQRAGERGEEKKSEEGQEREGRRNVHGPWQ